MKKLMLSLAASLFAVTVMAQPPHGPMDRQNGTPEEKAQKIASQMKEKLQLTDQQTTKLQAIYLESFNKQKQLMDQMKAVKDKQESDVKAVLTPEQYTKMLEDQKKMMERMRQGGGMRK